MATITLPTIIPTLEIFAALYNDKDVRIYLHDKGNKYPLMREQIDLMSVGVISQMILDRQLLYTKKAS